MLRLTIVRVSAARQRLQKNVCSLLKNNRTFWCFSTRIVYTWQNTLFFFQKFQPLRKRPVHRLFGWRICTINPSAGKDLSAWQGKRCCIVWFSIGVRIHLYTFIDHGWKKELRGWRISAHQSVSRKADEQGVCGEAETSEGFLGHSPREGYFSSKDGYVYQKEARKILKTCRKMWQLL